MFLLMFTVKQYKMCFNWRKPQKCKHFETYMGAAILLSPVSKCFRNFGVLKKSHFKPMKIWNLYCSQYCWSSLNGISGPEGVLRDNIWPKNLSILVTSLKTSATKLTRRILFLKVIFCK